jgi:hypothetical protein
MTWCFHAVNVSCHLDARRQARIQNAARSLTDSDQRNPLILVIAGDPLGPGVQVRLIIHQENVTMMAVRQLDSGHPGAIGHAPQGMRHLVPAIEIANQADGLGLRR